MAEFFLRIVTPDGLRYDGPAEKLVVRTTCGDVAILPGHIRYVAALGMGEAVVVVSGEMRRGACMGGMVCVADDKVTLVPASFEWAGSIDVERACRAQKQAEAALSDDHTTEAERKLAKARLKRALIRQHVAASSKKKAAPPR